MITTVGPAIGFEGSNSCRDPQSSGITALGFGSVMDSGRNFLQKQSGERLPCADFQNMKKIPVGACAMESGELLRYNVMKRTAEESIDGEFPGEWATCLSREIERSRSGVENKADSWRFSFVHHQVLKIREEDSHLGEDIGEGMSAKDKLSFLHLRSQVDALLCARPILRSSPLGNKTGIKSQ